MAEPSRDVRQLGLGALERLGQVLVGSVGAKNRHRTLSACAGFLDVDHRDVDLGEVLLVQLLLPPLG